MDINRDFNGTYIWNFDEVGTEDDDIDPDKNFICKIQRVNNLKKNKKKTGELLFMYVTHNLMKVSNNFVPITL